MSTKHNAMFAYGLLLDEKSVRGIYKNYYECEVPENLYDALYDLYEVGLICYESEFTGEAFPLDLAGRPCWGNALKSYCSDAIAYVQLLKEPALLYGAYHDLSEAVEEVHAAMDGLLPDDFDYHGRLCLILGTYYG